VVNNFYHVQNVYCAWI